MAKKVSPAEGREIIVVPRAKLNEDPSYVIGINGKNYSIPRGKATEVPREVAEEYHRSERATQAFYAKSDELLERAKGR